MQGTGAVGANPVACGMFARLVRADTQVCPYKNEWGSDPSITILPNCYLNCEEPHEGGTNAGIRP